MFDFSQIFTGPVIRKIAEIRDLGESILATVFDPDGGTVSTIASDFSDVYVKVKDVMTDFPIIGRLFAPGNIFWRLPRSGDPCLVVRGHDAHGPGAAYVFHGDGGTQGQAVVPTWLSQSQSGISCPESFRTETTGSASTIDMRNTHSSITIDGTGQVKLGDPTAAQDYLIKGTVYRTNQIVLDAAFTSFVGAVQTFVNIVATDASFASIPTNTNVVTAAQTLATLPTPATSPLGIMLLALSNFEAASAQYLSTTVKTK